AIGGRQGDGRGGSGTFRLHPAVRSGLKRRPMARKPRGQVRPPGPPGAQQHSQPPRPQVGGGSGGSWTPLRDAVRRDIEQAAAAAASAASMPEGAAPTAAATNGGAASEPPSPRVELRGRLLAATPQLGRALVTYRRTVTAVRRAAAPRRSPGPWRSDREVLEDARLAVDFARQLFDAYAEAWADQPTQTGLADGMSAETDRFLAWTQLARYMQVAAPRSQPPPPSSPEK